MAMGSWLWLQPAAVRGHGLRICIGVASVRGHGLLAVARAGSRAWPWASAVRYRLQPGVRVATVRGHGLQPRRRGGVRRLQPCGARVRCGVMGCDCAGHGCEGHEPGEGVIMCGGSDWQVMLE